VFLDSFSIEELETLKSVVFDHTKKYISATNVPDTEKDELRTFVARFEKALNENPFRLIVDDIELLIKRMYSVSNWGFDVTGTGKSLAALKREYEKNDPEHAAERIEGLLSSGIIARFEINAFERDDFNSLFGGLKGFAYLIVKLRYEAKRCSTLLLAESERLTAPCQITIPRQKLFSSGPKNNTNMTVFLNGKEIGSIIGGETLAASTHLVDNLIACMGNGDPPHYFRAQPGGEVRFSVFIPEITDINSFALKPET